MTLRPTRHAVLSIAGAALAGTLFATYPLLAGYSLVSPGNGPVALLYDQPPFTYSDRDPGAEPVRGSDVGAMMWAILPYTVVQREALAHGEFPLWNRYNLNGQPLWGQGQTFFLDPVHMLSLTIADPSVAMDLRFVAGRAIFALGGGVAVLLATSALPAAVIVAAAAPFSGHFISRLNHPAYFSIVYAPWVLAAFAVLVHAETRRGRMRAAALLALASWLQLVASTPKEGVVALAAAYAAGTVAVLARPGTLSDRLGRIDAVAMAGVVAVLLGAPHWLVFLDTLSRAWTAYGAAAVQVGGPAQAVAFALGSVAPGQPFTGTHALFTLAAACALLNPRALVTSGLGLGALVGVAGLAAIAFGVVPAALLEAVPLVRNIHHVWDASLAAAVPLMLVLAGVGLAAAIEARGSRPRLGLLVLAAATVTLGLAWMVPDGTATIAGLIARGTVSGAALAVLALALPIQAGLRRVLVGAGAAAAVLAGGLHLDTGIAALDEVLVQPRARADIGRLSPALQAVRAAATGEPFRVAPIDTVLFPGTQAYWRLEGIGGPDALRLLDLDTLAEGGGLIRTSWQWRTVLKPDAVAAASKYLDMLNVRFVVSREDQVPPGAAPLAMDGADAVRAVERPSAWPRAFFTPAVGRVTGTADFTRHMLAATGPFAAIDAPDEAAAAALGGLAGIGEAVAATGYAFTANTTRFRVRSPSPGVAVISESYVDHDFVATLNGARVPYYRVNRGMKGVFIPAAGEWEVAFEYRPRLWRWSWALAGLGLAGLAAMCVARNTPATAAVHAPAPGTPEPVR